MAAPWMWPTKRKPETFGLQPGEPKAMTRGSWSKGSSGWTRCPARSERPVRRRLPCGRERISAGRGHLPTPSPRCAASEVASSQCLSVDCKSDCYCESFFAHINRYVLCGWHAWHPVLARPRFGDILPTIQHRQLLRPASQIKFLPVLPAGEACLLRVLRADPQPATSHTSTFSRLLPVPEGLRSCDSPPAEDRWQTAYLNPS